jgi:short-subunit dehydrogenase
LSRAAPVCILITGASAGIGAALARAYAAPGRRLILNGRSEPALQEVAAECGRRGATVEVKALAVERTAEFMQWLGTLAEVDLAIVNAGVSSGGRARESWEEIDRVLETNLRGAIATVTALLPAMRRRGRGQIALMSSLAAWYGLPPTPAYSASKAGLKAYGEALRGWLARDGIVVSVVMPGFVRTAMSDRFPGPKPFLMELDDAVARIVRGLAAGRGRIAFPFPLAAGMWLLGALPASLSQRLLRALGFR